MPPPRQKKPKGKNGASDVSEKAITDPRFSNIQTDPRFRLPSRKHTRVQLDNRFSRMLKDEDFHQKASVDRYGRQLSKSAGKKELQRFYRTDKDEEHDDAESEDRLDDDVEVEKELRRVETKRDPARDGGFSESSSSESEENSSSDESDDETALQEDTAGAELAHEEIPVGEASARLAVVNLDWDNIRAIDLMAVASSFCPPDGRVETVSVYPSEFGKERMEREETEGPPKELFIKASKPASQRHDRHEDPEESHSDNSYSADDLDDEKIKSELLKEGDSADFDPQALRAYQLSRLRYYYAIITTSSTDTALAIYNAMDGREYLSTANFFDLRFVPDETTFPDSNDPSVPKGDKARDECNKVPDGYEANNFVTDALRHSNVRLTWDAEDRGRKEAQKRAFSRREIDENDLKAYIGSDSSDDEDLNADLANGGDKAHTETTDSAPISQAEAARLKMRLALGLDAEPAPSKKAVKGSKTQSQAPVGDMQITFSAALTDGPNEKGSVFANTPADVHEETTRERYIRLEKERKARRKAKARAARDGEDQVVPEEEETVDRAAAAAASKNSLASSALAIPDDDDAAAAADPFADPFFDDPTAANKSLQKAARKAKRAQKAEEALAAAAQNEKERKELELLMVEDNGLDAAANGNEDGAAKAALVKGRHFDMRAIKRAEKEAARKESKKLRKKKRRRDGADEDADDFAVPVADPRFAAVYESHEYAIDPTNARFSGTKSMKALLEEGRKRRGRKGRMDGEEGEAPAVLKRKRVAAEGDDENIADLVKRAKGRERSKYDGDDH